MLEAILGRQINMDDLKSITTQLGGNAYCTSAGHLLCRPCLDRNKGQLTRAGITFEVEPCAKVVECTLCGHSAVRL